MASNNENKHAPTEADLLEYSKQLNADNFTLKKEASIDVYDIPKLEVYGGRLNILFYGNTGAGKSSFLRLLLQSLGITNKCELPLVNSSNNTFTIRNTLYRTNFFNCIDSAGIMGTASQKHIVERVNAIICGTVPELFDTMVKVENQKITANDLHLLVHAAVIVINPYDQSVDIHISNAVKIAKALYDNFNRYMVLFVITHKHSESMKKEAELETIRKRILTEMDKHATICLIENEISRYPHRDSLYDDLNMFNTKLMESVNANIKCLYSLQGAQKKEPHLFNPPEEVKSPVVHEEPQTAGGNTQQQQKQDSSSSDTTTYKYIIGAAGALTITAAVARLFFGK